MARVSIETGTFGVWSIAQRKARAVEAEAGRHRAAATAAAARVRIANGDAEIARLGLTEGAVRRTARSARFDGVWTALFGVLATMWIGSFGVVVRKGLSLDPMTATWGTFAFTVGFSLFAAGSLSLLAYAIFGGIASGILHGIADLARSSGTTLVVGRDRLYLTEVDRFTRTGEAIVREIRYDGLGSVRHDAAGLRLFDRLGVPVVALGGVTRIDAGGGVDEAVAAIRTRIPGTAMAAEGDA